MYESYKHPIIQLPEQFALAMSGRHDSCLKSKDHATTVNSKDDLRLITKELREKLRFPVLMAMLNDGWQFEGVRICPVSNINTRI